MRSVNEPQIQAARLLANVTKVPRERQIFENSFALDSACTFKRASSWTPTQNFEVRPEKPPQRSRF